MKKVSKGTANPDSSGVIVEREFELRSDAQESRVLARFRRPVADGKADFRCEVEIEGLEELSATYAIGIDVIQAYELALQSAALHLLSSSAYQGGRLTYRGSYDLDLPVPKSASYLVRTDLERDLVVREMAGKDDSRKRFSEASLARLEDRSKVWPDPEDAPVVLERVLDLRRGRKRTDVRVVFRKPVPNRLGHWCGFKIEGLLAKPHVRKGMLGGDPIESLRNAMRLAMVYIVSSPAYQRGQVTWLGSMYDLGMPIFEEVEPLIRKDLHAKAIAEVMMVPRSRLWTAGRTAGEDSPSRRSPKPPERSNRRRRSR